MPHNIARALLLRAQAAQIPRGQALLIGDSITEMQWLPTLCGRQALNGGIGGSDVAAWETLGPELVALARPAVVVIAVGINDAVQADWRAPDWQTRYRRLVEQTGAPLQILVAPNPIERAKGLGRNYDPAVIAAEQAYVATLAALPTRAGVRRILVPAPASLAGQTIDGVHPAPAASRDWIARLAAACPAH